MRLRWVGDSRDYVKWDCVFENARNRLVFYIPMLRNSIDTKCTHPEVQDFFDNSKNLDNFKHLFPSGFEVFGLGEEYSVKNADEYFQRAVTRLKSLQKNHPLLVFVDPDTGIEPKSGAKNEHVRQKDITSIWQNMKSKDCLVIYQHASRNSNWRQEIGERIQRYLEISPDRISEPYCNAKLAGDVCFFVLEKSST